MQRTSIGIKCFQRKEVISYETEWPNCSSKTSGEELEKKLSLAREEKKQGETRVSGPLYMEVMPSAHEIELVIGLAVVGREGTWVFLRLDCLKWIVAPVFAQQV